MQHWRTPYLGLRDVPPGLDDFELVTFFSFSAAELRIIRSRRLGLHRLAVALHLGFIRMTGRTLDAFDRIPRRLLTHLAAQIDVTAPDLATLKSLYAERERTLSDHQRVAYDALGFRLLSEHQRRYVTRWLREALVGSGSSGSLLTDLKRWFYDHRILLIADRELKRLIAAARADQLAQLSETLVAVYGARRLTQWGDTLIATRQDGAPIQTWLWSPPQKQSTVQMSELAEKITYLRDLGVHGQWPSALNDATIRHHGRRCAYRPPSASQRIISTRRHIEVACFLRYSLCTATDQFLIMLRRWIRRMVSKAANETAPSFSDAQRRLRELGGTLRALAANEAISETELRDQLRTLADATLSDVKLSRAALGRAWLIEHPHQARSVLASIVQLPLAADGDHLVVSALAVLRSLYAARCRELPMETTLDFGRRWCDALQTNDRAKALAAFEWATLLKLRAALRNGSVFLEHSFAFRGHSSLLVPAPEWRARRHLHYGHLKLPERADEFLAPLQEQLRRRADEFAAAVADGRLRVDDEGMHFDRPSADGEASTVLALRRALYAGRSQGQIAEMMLHIDARVRFSWLLLGREPHSQGELLLTYAGVLALSTAMSSAQVARMIPALSAEAVRQMARRLSDDRRLRLASDAAYEYLHRFEIAQFWGRGELASADMMSLETPRAIWQARADPRRKTASVGVYTHVLDRWGIFYDQPIVLNRRQAGAALEGVIRQSVVDDIGQLAVDTHGYTHFAMAQAKLLRFDLCPWLADFGRRQLSVPKGFNVPSGLGSVMAADVELDAIRAVYDELVRVAASIRTGQCSAVQALDRFGSDARGQAVYEGGVRLGQLLCTLYQMDFFLNSSFRGELRHALNRGEAIHALQRAIHDGQVPHDLARHDDSLHAVSSSLSLMCNVVMAWNAEHMQQAYERMSTGGVRPAADDLRRVAPTNVEGVNFRGTFEFPVERYAERILPSLRLPPPSTAAAIRRQH